MDSYEPVVIRSYQISWFHDLFTGSASPKEAQISSLDVSKALRRQNDELQEHVSLAGPFHRQNGVGFPSLRKSAKHPSAREVSSYTFLRFLHDTCFHEMIC